MMDTNIFKETIFLVKCHVKLINIWDKLEKVIILERLLVYLAREVSMDDTSCS